MMSALLTDLVRLGYALAPLQLAYHEAGHVLVAHATGREVTKVSLDRHGGLTFSEGRATPLTLLLVSLAGDLAEQLTPGCMSDLVTLASSDSADTRDADLALGLIAGGSTERAWILEDAIREVDKFLTEHRGVLDRLARRLLQHRVLNGEELHRILES